ncbi:DUF2231 domain-containing protein [Thermodesulfobacteriota bacterium]
MPSNLKEFTLDELREFNGDDGRPAYVAYEGKVHDVSGSRYWQEGLHMKRHKAGCDLTTELCAAPHGSEVIKKIPQVGTLQSCRNPMDENIPDFLLALYEKIPMLRRHPHPMMVHYPIAFVITVPVFITLYLITGWSSLESTAFHLLLLSLMSTPVAMLTGLYAWWVNYGRRPSFNIKVKISVSIALFLLLAAAMTWRLIDPDVMASSSGAMVPYYLLSLSFLPLVIVLGWFGAKMTFPH